MGPLRPWGPCAAAQSAHWLIQTWMLAVLSNDSTMAPKFSTASLQLTLHPISHLSINKTVRTFRPYLQSLIHLFLALVLRYKTVITVSLHARFIACCTRLQNTDHHVNCLNANSTENVWCTPCTYYCWDLEFSWRHGARRDFCTLFVASIWIFLKDIQTKNLFWLEST